MKGHDWLSERVLFGTVIMVGYFVFGGFGVLLPLDDDQRQMAKDVMIVIGPIIGMIAAAIWKTDKADKQAAAAAATMAAKMPDMSGTGSGQLIDPASGQRVEPRA